MRIALLTVLAAGVAAQLSGATVGFQVTSLGGNTFRYNYFISGFMFQQNQELDIFFDPARYGMLFNGVAQPASDWSLLLFQPNNPPGAPGDYSLAARVNNPSLAGPFSVDFTFLGPVRPGPGSQPFTIFDQNFVPIQSGVTTPQGQGAVPEPASFSLAMAGLILGGFWAARRRAV